MRKLSRFTLLITLPVILFAACRNQPTTATKQQNVPFGNTNPRNLIVIDDLDVAIMPPHIAVDTANLDTTKVVIWGNNGGMINGRLQRASTNDRFMITNGGNTQYNITFPTTIDTLMLANLELYYTLPAVMDGDTVRVLVPRRYMIAPSSNGGGNNGGGNNGGGN